MTQPRKILAGGVDPAFIAIENPDIDLLVHWFCAPEDITLPKAELSKALQKWSQPVGLPRQELFLDNTRTDSITHRAVLGEWVPFSSSGFPNPEQVGLRFLFSMRASSFKI